MERGHFLTGLKIRSGGSVSERLVHQGMAQLISILARDHSRLTLERVERLSVTTLRRPCEAATRPSLSTVQGIERVTGRSEVSESGFQFH